MLYSKLTMMIAGLGMMLGTACFVTTESDRFTDTAGTGGGGGGCAVGSPACPCTGSGACDDGLECVDMLNICVINTDCDVGSAGCGCTAGGTCDPGLMCADVEPSPGVCVSDNPCLDENIASEGCQCTAGGACDPGLECLSGLCVMVPEPGTGTTEPMTDTNPDPTVDPTTAGDSSSTSDGGSSGSAADTSGGAAPTSGA